MVTICIKNVFPLFIAWSVIYSLSLYIYVYDDDDIYIYIYIYNFFLFIGLTGEK